MMWKLWKKSKTNSEKIGKNMEENSEMIWKIWKKVVKKYGKDGRKPS